MIPKLEFDQWLDKLFQIHELDLKIKKQFYFLTFDNYNSAKEDFLFIIYEDWWIYKTEIVKSKIKSILKLSNRIFARQCIVKKIDKPEADVFLNINHLYDSTNSKVKYALYYEDELCGLATFAGQRQFIKGRSVELLRYCNKIGYIVVGGLDKLMKAYIKEYRPYTIMTYIDIDWGRGDAFKKLGFEHKETKPAITFFTNKRTGFRIPEKHFNDFVNIKDYIKVKNKGSLKMIKTLKP